MERATQLAKQCWKSMSVLQVCIVGLLVGMFIFVPILRSIEVSHHHVRAARAITYSSAALGVVVVLIYILLEIVRRTQWLRNQVEPRLEKPTENMEVMVAEALFAKNHRVLFLASLIEPKLLDEYHVYLGTAISPSEMLRRYPDVHTFWSKSMEYNSECAHYMARIYATQSTAFLAYYLVQLQRRRINSGYVFLPDLCNIAYIALHATNGGDRKVFKSEYNRHRVADKDD